MKIANFLLLICMVPPMKFHQGTDLAPAWKKTTARKLLYAAALIADDCSQSLQCNTHRTAILVSHVLTR